jgi:hypothetical protein
MAWEEEQCGGPPIIQPAQFKDATLDSPQVQAFIKNAYEYHKYTTRQKSGPEDRQTGYLMPLGNKPWQGIGPQDMWRPTSTTTCWIMVASAQQSYDITHMAVYNLPDRNHSETLQFHAERSHRCCLGKLNSECLMGGGAYYVRFVSDIHNNEIVVPPRSSGNSTTVIPDSYFLQFNLVNGTAWVSAYC